MAELECNAEEQALRDRVNEARAARDEAYSVVSRHAAETEGPIPSDVLYPFDRAQRAFEAASADLDAFEAQKKSPTPGRSPGERDAAI